MTLHLRHSWVHRRAVFTWYDIDKVAPGGVKEGYTSTKIVKEGYTSTKILAQGGIANDLYDLYSILSLLMSWCMFWGMSLK